MAGTTVITNPKIRIAFTASLAAGDLSAPAAVAVDVGTDPRVGVSPGVGAAVGQVSAVYAIEGTVSSGSPVTIDVTSLTDPAGNAIPSLARVLGFCIENLSVTAGQIITLAGGASNPLFSDQMTLQPNTDSFPVGGTGAIWNPAPGYAVDSTHKTIMVSVAAGSNVRYNLALFGNAA